MIGHFWLHDQGYDVFLLGGTDRLVPISGESWDERFELCLHEWVHLRESFYGHCGLCDSRRQAVARGS